MNIEMIGQHAKEASRLLAKLSEKDKDRGLIAAAECLRYYAGEILEANNLDIANAREKGMPEPMIDRLMLTKDRIESMAQGLIDIAGLKNPVGEIVSSTVRPNGLEICQKRVPIGVVGIIYESRPNVTADAFGLCFKTGNAVILRGGSDAINSNKIIVSLIRKALKQENICEDAVLLVEDTDHDTVHQMMRMNRYIDVLIPRGGAGLIKTVVENSTVPVIETGTGNCHIYIDEDADISMAVSIVENAKTQRTGVCNACESLVIHEAIMPQVLPALYEMLQKHQCELRGDEAARNVVPELVCATQEDWGTEYLDLIASVKTVSSIEEAIVHINRYNTGHSEAIITNNYAHARQFLDEVDAAAVYVNASTRFTDGFEFGFGAEIGISTQKLHARGPMGLKELTTTKYVIYGNGQIRG